MWTSSTSFFCLGSYSPTDDDYKVVETERNYTYAIFNTVRVITYSNCKFCYYWSLYSICSSSKPCLWVGRHVGLFKLMKSRLSQVYVYPPVEYRTHTTPFKYLYKIKLRAKLSPLLWILCIIFSYLFFCCTLNITAYIYMTLILLIAI